jgi:hypothetical protein
VARRQQRTQCWTRLDFVAAVAQQQQERRGLVLLEPCAQDRNAVEVTPMQVVDPHDQWPRLRQAAEEIAQRNFSALAKRARLTLNPLLADQLLHRTHAFQNGEQLR